MIEKLYLLLIIFFFILAFTVKNIKTYFSTKQSIKGNSKKLTVSILASSLIYILIILRLTILEPIYILEFNIFDYEFVKIIGYILITIGFIIGVLSLIAMKNSWRVGIKYKQKTKLITSGLYKISRNPYFLSYYILILGFIFIFPSLIISALYFLLVIMFHKMVLEEEKYLKSIHGQLYLNYKKNTNRYLTVMYF